MTATVTRLLRQAASAAAGPRGKPFQRRQFRAHSILSNNGQAVRKLTSAAPQVQQQVESWELNLTGVDEERLQGRRGNWWWSGKRPDELLAPGESTLHSLPQPTLNGVTEAQVKEYFDNTWTLTEVLFSGMQGEEAFYRPPYHHLRHPMIFYYGHTASFYVNKLYVAGLVDAGINRYFEDIFEVGVDEMRWDDMSKNAMHWPSVGDVREYRGEVYRLVSNAIDKHMGDSGSSHVGPDHPLWSMFMAFEHDRIHLETSSVLLRELPLELLRKPEYWPEPHESHKRHASKSNPIIGKDFPANELVHVDGAPTVTIGKQRESPSYGWDNEYGERVITNVPSFDASRMMVSNGEFYEFVKDGGYRRKEFWSEDGWGWRTFRNAKWPFFWSQEGPAGKHEYALRTVFEVVDMPWDWPVNVNKHEATAFCNWKSSQPSYNGAPLRLVTEAEHLLLREPHQRHPVTDPANDPALNHGGATISEAAGVNLNLAYGSETPVDMHPPNRNGFHDVMGNAWEWAEDDFNPLPGFEVHPYYDDFSTPCFDGEHNMILGGSFVSSGDAGANLHCRYHFRPHFLQHSGFRYVRPHVTEAWPGEGVATRLSPPTKGTSGAAQQQGSQGYETDQLVNQYLALHFGQQPEVVDATVRQHPGLPQGALNFPQRCADLVREMAQQHGAHIGSEARALDLGCAVGGASFALADSFGHVTGIDFSHAFIAKACAIRDAPGRAISFSVPVEGTITRENIVARISPDLDPSALNFFQGDACALPEASDLGGRFDAVLMANLLCRLPEPTACLASLRRLVNTGGIVVTVSPFSWMEDFTRRDKWLQQGDRGSAGALEKVMRAHGFEQVYLADMPLLIREHERKYQYIVSSAAAFKKVE